MIPKDIRKLLTTPIDGLKIIFQTTATATRDATYGKKNTVLKKFRPNIFLFSNIAIPNDATKVNGTVAIEYTTVFFSAILNVVSVISLLKLSKPAKLIGLAPSQFKKDSINANITGINVKIAKPKKLGRINE
ncbi:hypothetical protein GCM10008907_16480 [Clostridium sartagoforme]